MGLEARGQRVGRRVPSRSSIGGTGPLTKRASPETDQSSNRRATVEARARCSGREGAMPPKRKLPTVHAGEPMTSVRAPGKRSKNAVSPPVEHTRPLFTSMPMTSSPHPTTKSTSLLRLREFVWVGGCVTARATWASPPGRRRRSVHKSVEMAPRGRFGSFVYTIGPWAWVVGSLGIATVYTNGRTGPLRAGLGRLCTLLGCCAVVDRRGDAGVYTNRWKWPLGAVSGHLCTLLRRESRYELRRELRQVA